MLPVRPRWFHVRAYKYSMMSPAGWLMYAWHSMLESVMQAIR